MILAVLDDLFFHQDQERADESGADWAHAEASVTK